jgi:hypothetical protein
MSQVFGTQAAEVQNVIKENKDEMAEKRSENRIHQGLESCRGIRKTKRHH